MPGAPVEQFASLIAANWLRHGFLLRVPGLDVRLGKEEALAALRADHDAALDQIGLGGRKRITCEQVHGSLVTRVDRHSLDIIPGCDGLLTDDPEVVLGIYTADCGAIFLADPMRRAIGLLHSGKKGTELDILTTAITAMTAQFGSQPNDLIVQLAPCIRPPHYEIDFAATIARQAREAGVVNFFDCGVSTACDPARYYSYRAEFGKTGRHLAVLGYAD